MSAIQLLRNEQVTLIRLAAATDVAEIKKHKQALKKIGSSLRALPYAHRPYHPLTKRPTEPGLALGVWENEGGKILGPDNEMLQA